ncbi:MAG TPA: PAS domain S-box protein [Dehalococcoidales bacterium]|nr:PAS domain S-box protein [Dehalococcoidales bacterium]
MRILRNPGFWLILAVLVLITLPHYAETLKQPAFLVQLTANLGLGRHAFERVLYLAPIVWAGFLFGWKGAFITSLAALALMLPRAVFISPQPKDALFETGAVFIVSNVLTISFVSLRREREYRRQLELAHQELRISEERYRQLFENALDAIWLHDLEGNIIAANRAAEKLSGYSIGELTKMNVRSFLSEESLHLAGQVRHSLLAKEEVGQPYEQHLTRKDGGEVFVQLATSLVFNRGEPVAFQHIARDVTEQKRMNENLRFYLRQATRAQEEERKRISHELHDDTIQALVVLSRQLDTLASGDTAISAGTRLRLEELRKQTNDTIQGIRRLSQDLRPAALDRLGLRAALEWLASDVTRYSGIATLVRVMGKERRLTEEVELVLFRITQEALRNVWRHSGATSAEIIVEFNDSKTRITVSDDGQGFKLPGKIGDLAKDGKLGLAGMQERVQLVGGTLTIQSQPGKGTSITVVSPL